MHEQIEYKVCWRTYGGLDLSTRAKSLEACEAQHKNLQKLEHICEVWIIKKVTTVERTNVWTRKSKLEI